MAAATDTRILTEQELEEYAKDYHMLEDLSHYDFSKIDFDSDHFRTLPPAEQYSILNAARLRSRLRMGYTKEQLDEMFPDRLAFSRFQIQRLKERNDYTQRLMNLNGMNNVGPQRIAGEKGREYYLVRNEGAEGGWVLGISGPGGAKEKPVLVDVEEKVEEEGEDDEFEDVPLETSQEEEEPPEVLKTLTTKQRQVQTQLSFNDIPKRDEELFVVDEEEEEEFEDPLFVNSEEKDAELQAAILLSMQEQGPRPIDLDSLRSESSVATSITDEHMLHEAIVQSLAGDVSRPVISDSKTSCSDLREPLGQSLDDMQPIPGTSHADISRSTATQILISEKGKGKAASSSVEQFMLEPQRILVEESPARDPASVVPTPFITESRSKANVLGGSLFRRKEPVGPAIATALRQTKPTNPEMITISPWLGQDAGLEEKTQETSPHFNPTSRILSPSPAPEPTTSITIGESEESEVDEAPVEPSREILALPIVPELSQNAIDQTRPSTSQSQLTHATESSHDDANYRTEDDDEDLLEQFAAEAEEHARFTSSINPNASSRPEDYTLYGPNLTEEDFEQEMRSLRMQQKRDRRDADEVNQLMVAECQQLLRLFGLPFITAPMEAEAQCAELVRLGLVDGIVTDDSDIFLFGGTRVYKNMFNQGKFVECYLASDLQRDYNLDRQKFINLAHLLGSDYAEGIPHVGPVNALELLSEFPGPRGLEQFRDWWIAVQQGRLLTRDPGESEFRRKFKRNSTKIFLPTDFPNRIIDNAYVKPEVDHDPQGFVWGVPDLDALRSFLMSQIGWSKERTDEVLVPVIRDMNRRQVQHPQ